MIEVTIYKDSDSDHIIGFHTYGHAEYADAGYDIICSAVSIIITNTMNSIDELTDDLSEFHEKQEDGEMEFRIQGRPCDDTELLFRSMMLGLDSIQKNYGKRYIRVNTKEV